VNFIDPTGKSPLIAAAETGDIEICELLIQLGADLNLTDDTGRSAAAYAQDNNHHEVVAYIEKSGGKNIHTMPG